MPTFTFTLTRDVTESATVTISADSIEDAHAQAVANPPLDGWNIDDNEGGEPYIPDPDDYDVGPGTAKFVWDGVAYASKAAMEAARILDGATADGDPVTDQDVIDILSGRKTIKFIWSLSLNEGMVNGISEDYDDAVLEIDAHLRKTYGDLYPSDLTTEKEMSDAIVNIGEGDHWLIVGHALDS